MKTKLIFSLALLIVVGMSSCKKESKLIIGTWKLASVTPADPDAEPCEFNSTITFKDDDTFTDTNGCTNESYGGSYSVDKDKLTMTPSIFPISIVFVIEDIDKEEMTISLGSEKSVYRKQ
jgi:hypothetical protein